MDQDNSQINSHANELLSKIQEGNMTLEEKLALVKQFNQDIQQLNHLLANLHQAIHASKQEG